MGGCRGGGGLTEAMERGSSKSRLGESCQLLTGG